MAKGIKIEYIALDQIHEYANNPRQNKKAIDAVARSIQEFGIRAPAIIDKENVLLAGHTRVQAARKLGLTEFPCVRADDLTKEEAAGYRLMDNRAGEDSEWDMSLLADEFKALKATGFDLTITGFEPFEIDSISFDATAGLTPETDIPHAGQGGQGYEGGDCEDSDSQAFVCIICTLTDEEREFVKDLVQEDGTLKTRYTLKDIVEGK